jgi:hypothetical protein
MIPTGQLPIHGHKNQNDGGVLDDTAFTNPPGRSWEYWKHYGTANFESWYTTPIRNNAFTSFTAASGTQYAIPFPILKGQSTDMIGIYISNAAAGGARLGIYADNGNLYPGNLVIDAGAVTTASTGVRSESCVQALSEGALYWLSLLAGAAYNLNGVASADTLPILGFPNTLNGTQNPMINVSQAYGALPATFPAGGSILAGVVPLVFVRFSS